MVQLESTAALECSIHRLPFQIDYNGEAPVSSYFVVDSSNSLLTRDGESNFRGHGLISKKISLPKAYQGMVYKQVTGTLTAAAKFDSLTVWEHDLEPALGSNAVLNAMAFLPINDTINS